MNLTRRGRAVIIGAVLAASFAAGARADLWNPYTRQLDHAPVQVPTLCMARPTHGAVQGVAYLDPASPRCR